MNTLPFLTHLTTAKAKPIKTIPGKGGIVKLRRNLRASVRGLWSGVLTKPQATRTFSRAMETGIEAAWVEGAAECGIQADELTVEELTKRDEFIFEQLGYVPEFMAAIVKGNKKSGGKLVPLFERVELWVNQYPNAKMQSEALACKNEKRIWKLGISEHCKSCVSLQNQVRRLSFWKANVMPKNPPNKKILCGGWSCKCQLLKTDKPLTRGRLPKLP